MAIKFSGINIFSVEPEKSFEWYKGIGFTVDNEDEPDSKWYGATFNLTNTEGGPLLWIWRRQDDMLDEIIQCQIVINCDDIQQTYRELKDKGYAVREPQLQFYGGWEMPLKDPNGNTLLFLG